MSVSTELATQEQTVQQKALAEIESKTKAKAELAKLAAASASIVKITNADGYRQAQSARMALVSERVAISKYAKGRRDYVTQYSKANIAAERELIAVIEPEEIRLEAVQKVWDDAIAAVKQAEAEKEAKRVAGIRAAIEEIAVSPMGSVGGTAEQIRERIAEIEAETIDESGYAELLPFALAARVDALAKLRPMLAERMELDAEREQQRLAKIEADKLAAIEAEKVASERAELAKLRAENERLAKIEQERQAEAARREREQLDRERQQQEAAAKIERDRIAAEAEVARKAHEAREAEAKKLRDAEDARIAADRKKLADEQEAARIAAHRELTAKKQKQRAEITGLVATHYKITADKALKLLQELYA